MPFGLKGSPKTFTRLVEMLFGPKFDESVFVYIDDSIIISEDFESHLKLVERVLKRLLEAGLKVKKTRSENLHAQVLHIWDIS